MFYSIWESETVLRVTKSLSKPCLELRDDDPPGLLEDPLVVALEHGRDGLGDAVVLPKFPQSN